MIFLFNFSCRSIVFSILVFGCFASGDPSLFPDCSNVLKKAAYDAKRLEIEKFLDNSGNRKFLSDHFPEGMPPTVVAFGKCRIRELYQVWYESKQQAALLVQETQEKLATVIKEAEAKVLQHQEVVQEAQKTIGELKQVIARSSAGSPAGFGTGYTYKEILTPRPPADPDEPKSIIAFMDSYYLMIDEQSKRQKQIEEIKEDHDLYEAASRSIQTICKEASDKIRRNSIEQISDEDLDAICSTIGTLSSIAELYTGNRIDGLISEIRRMSRKWAPTYIPTSLTDFFTKLTEEFVKTKTCPSSNRAFLKVIDLTLETIKSKEELDRSILFTKYKEALTADEKKVKELIDKEEQNIYGEFLSAFPKTLEEIQVKLDAFPFDINIAIMSEDEIRRENLRRSGAGEPRIDDKKNYTKIPSILRFIRTDPVFMLIALDDGSLWNYFGNTPNPQRDQKFSVFRLFEQELNYLEVSERKVFFVFLKEIVDDFESMKEKVFKIKTRYPRIEQAALKEFLSTLKESFEYPKKENYKYNEGLDRIKPFYALLKKFEDGVLGKEFQSQALYEALPFLDSKLKGITAAEIRLIRESVSISERDQTKDIETLEKTISYLQENAPIEDIILRDLNDVLQEIETLREAKRIIESSSFDSNLTGFKLSEKKKGRSF